MKAPLQAASSRYTGGAPSTRSAEDRRARAPSIAAFFEIGSLVPGGLPFQPWARDLKNKRTTENAKDNPDAYCLPLGNMQLHLHPQPRKIIQSKNEIVILYEGNAGIRQIFTDGRPLPSGDPQPWWFGYSTGRWEGTTLVVQTSGFRDGGWLDVNGSPLTDAGKTTERIPARQLRHTRNRSDHRRREGLHETVDGEVQPAADAGRRTDQSSSARKRAIDAALQVIALSASGFRL